MEKYKPSERVVNRCSDCAYLYTMDVFGKQDVWICDDYQTECENVEHCIVDEGEEEEWTKN